MKPPSDVAPSELWAKLTEAPRPTEIVDFPRRDKHGKPLDQIRIQVLTEGEHTRARYEGRRKVMQKYSVTSGELDDIVMKEILSDTCAREALSMACLSVDPMPGSKPDAPTYARVFPNPDKLSELTSDELVVLFNAYTMVQAKYGPFASSIRSQDELNAWMRVLVEGGREHFLAHRSWHQLAELAISLAQRGYLLSLIIESLSSDSQSISEQHLAELGIGTSWFTGQRLASAETGLMLAPNDIESESFGIDDALLFGADPDESVTLEKAAQLAKDKGRG